MMAFQVLIHAQQGKGHRHTLLDGREGKGITSRGQKQEHGQ